MKNDSERKAQRRFGEAPLLGVTVSRRSFLVAFLGFVTLGMGQGLRGIVRYCEYSRRAFATTPVQQKWIWGLRNGTLCRLPWIQPPEVPQWKLYSKATVLRRPVLSDLDFA